MGVTARPGGETAGTVGWEGIELYFWRAQLREREEVTGGRRWCPVSGPGLLPGAELRTAIVLQLLYTRDHAWR